MKKIFAIIGPTGSGKSHAADHILDNFNVKYIPSVTTRPKRPKEESIYKHYSKKDFEEFIRNSKLLEHTTYDNHYYGKLIEDVDSHLEDNHCIYVLTADRVKELKERKPNTVVICLNIPEPIEQNVVNRLTNRGHNIKEIENRLISLREELKVLREVKSGNLIDYEIHTIEGNKNHTLISINEIIEKEII